MSRVGLCLWLAYPGRLFRMTCRSRCNRFEVFDVGCGDGSRFGRLLWELKCIVDRRLMKDVLCNYVGRREAVEGWAWLDLDGGKSYSLQERLHRG